VRWRLETATGTRILGSVLTGREGRLHMLGKSLGHYKIVEKIGEGGMGVVYRATDSRLRRDVALKMLPEVFADDPQRRQRFEHEAQVLASLNHPNIAAIYGLEEADKGHALVMEFVEGTTLSARIRQGAMPPEEIFPLAQQMCAALSAAHEKGIIHRDLKPANIKITPQGRVKVLDFGLAEAMRIEPGLATSDESTMDSPIEMPKLAGTLPYMAPEQLRGEPVDVRTDVYALGAVFYEMATGKRSFGDSQGAQLIADIQQSPPKPPRWLVPAIPARLEEIILKCLEKDPENRYRSMADLADALRDAASRGGVPEKSLAVLYFENLGGGQEDAFFCEGITDDIIIELSKIASLMVFSRAAVLAFRNKSVPAIEAGRKLGALYVLDGSVRRSGDRLRITTQLVETRTARSLWSERYDRQLEDVFAIQDEIAQSIARTLRVMLSEAERRVIAKVPTTDVEAYESYLRGRQYFRQFRRKSIEFARQMIARAIEIDPGYALAYAALADCYSYLYMFWEASEQNLQAADEASRRAVELDPELAEAYVARGVAISIGKRYEEADREFETAIRLNPRLFEAYYFCARGFYARGKLEQAVSWFERAIRARPEDYQAPILMASALAGLGRKAESDASFRNGLERAQKHLEIDPGDARAMYFSAIALCQLGESPEQSLEWAERALAMDSEEPQVLYNVGCVYALLGRADRAIECLATTIAHGGWWRTWMRNDPDLRSLESDPRFRALVQEPEGP
jgi:serine/threonine protein kinase/Tfp pilus assembly protein PilF